MTETASNIASRLPPGAPSLNEEQKAIVERVLQAPLAPPVAARLDRPNLRATAVAAGAGTGKTHTSVACVIALLEAARRASSDINANDFALITFTNKAAGELRGRLQRDLGEVARRAGDDATFWEEQEERLGAAYIGTIHGYCRTLARQFAYTHHLARDTRIGGTGDLLDEAFREAVATHLATGPRQPLLDGRNGWTHFEFRQCALEAHRLVRQAGMPMRRVLEATRAAAAGDDGGPWRAAFAALVADMDQCYVDACGRSHRLDPDSLLSAFRDALCEGEAFCAQATARYPFVLVDEFQDTDRVQDAILRTMEPRLARLIVVGDRKQSIYAFRGAQYSLLEQLSRDLTGADPLPLTLSRRPTLNLLEAQNALFGALRQHYPQLDEPLGGAGRAAPGGTLPAMRYTEVADEAEGAAELRTLIGQTIPLRRLNDSLAAVEPGDIAVLARTNAHVDIVVRALSDAGIPAEADAGARVFSEDEIVAVRRLLVLLSVWDDGAAIEALSTPLFPEVAIARQEAIILSERPSDLPARRHRFIDNLIDNLDDQGLLRRLEELRRKLPRVTISELLGTMYLELGLPARVRRAYGHDAVLGLDRLRDLARGAAGNSEALTLDMFVELLDREILADRRIEVGGEQDGLPPHVRVMTVHRAKGLEFPIVVLPFLSRRSGLWRRDLLLWPDGRLEAEVRAPDAPATTLSPSFQLRLNTERDVELEQDMRLLYVAVTRAQNHVLFLGDQRARPERGRPKTWQGALLAARPALQALVPPVAFTQP